jgi:predicted small secreted protein
MKPPSLSLVGNYLKCRAMQWLEGIFQSSPRLLFLNTPALASLNTTHYIFMRNNGMYYERLYVHNVWHVKIITSNIGDFLFHCWPEMYHELNKRKLVYKTGIYSPLPGWLNHRDDNIMMIQLALGYHLPEPALDAYIGNVINNYNQSLMEKRHGMTPQEGIVLSPDVPPDATVN